MSAVPAIHVFEKAGLGRAPFRCVGVASIPSSSLAASNSDAYRNAMASLPQNIGVGSCRYCGTCLVHNFIIVSADDRRFVVGCDCVAKTGDAGLAKEVKRARVAVALEKRTAARSLAKAEREALWAVERVERAKAFSTEHAALIERAQACYDNPFIRDVTERGIAGGFISDRALAALISAVTGLEESARRRAASRHVGTVGKRETFEVVVERINSFTRPSFSGYGSDETVWVVTMRDANDAAIVSKTPAFCPEKGERLTIKATIKAHDEYRGERQTLVQRVKVVSKAA